MHIKISRSYKVFRFFNILFLGILAILCLLPIINVLAISLSSTTAVKANQVTLFPVGFNLENYRYILENDQYLHALLVSVMRVVAGTAIAMLVTFITAYPLAHSSREFKGRNAAMWLLIVPMLFSGGLIPTYLIYHQIGILNTFWVLVLPGALQIYNTILMVNFFKGIPKSLQEAAKLDGAGHLSILIKVYLPLAIPSIATLSLFCAVGHWNSWFDGLVYIDDQALRPLQSMIKSMLNELNGASGKLLKLSDIQRLAYINDRSLMCAQIFVGTLPILLVYPFIQKYFVGGMTLGAVKE